jgi:hypothetical protein
MPEHLRHINGAVHKYACLCMLLGNGSGKIMPRLRIHTPTTEELLDVVFFASSS